MLIAENASDQFSAKCTFIWAGVQNMSCKIRPSPCEHKPKKVAGIFKKILRWNGTPPAKYLRIYGKYKYERVEKSWLFPNISLEKGSTLFS